MKIKIKKVVESDATLLHVDAGVRYWEDATVNGVEDTEGSLIPFRDGDRWQAMIDIEKGQILNWPKGTIANIHYKVCDDGVYELKDADGNTILKHDGYVPEIMCPEDEGYGDYIIMTVDGEGMIANWKPTIKGFDDHDEDDD